MIVLTSDGVAANALIRTNLALDCWAWSEALHIGPIGKTNDLETFARQRAVVYGSLGWDECQEVEVDFGLRNEALKRAVDGGQEIVLLFGKGIRDQLPLARLLAWLADRASFALGRVRLALSNTDVQQTPGEVLDELVHGARTVSMAQVRQYESFWGAFASSDPMDLENWRRGSEEGLLAEAAERLMQEFPSSDNGLSLTECQILDILSLGVESPWEVFERFLETENAPYLNDWEFWLVLERLMQGYTPLATLGEGDSFLRPPKDLAWKPFQNQRIKLRLRGERVLAGEEHYGQLDFRERWIGGVRLHSESLWYWDYQQGCLTRDPLLRSAL